VEGGHQAVAEGRGGEGFDVVGGDVSAALKEGADFAGEDEHLAGTRTCAPAEHAFHIFGGSRLVRTCGADEVEDEVDDMIRHGDFAGELLRGLQILGGEHGVDLLAFVPVVRLTISRSSSRVG
jgi:hypothetical protein